MTDIRVTYGDAVYCTVDDVAGMFRKDAAFGQDTNPSDNTILSFIKDASDEIDAYTRHAWRENTVTEEYKQYSTYYRWDAGRPLMLNKMDVRTPLDSASGDKLELWDGDTWNDWVSDSAKTEGRDVDYWLDGAHGQLWIYDRFVWRSRPQLRVTYRYGTNNGTSSHSLGDGTSYTLAQAPRDIRKACRKLVAAELIDTDQHTQLVPGGEGAPNPSEAVKRWRADVFGNNEKTGLLDRHKVDPAWVEPY